MRLPILAIAAGLMMLVPAQAHTSHGGMAYSAYCCSGDEHTGDCAAIPDSSVTPVQGGWRIVLRKGQHRMVKSPVVEHFVPYGSELKATDGKYHACLHPSEDTMRCFYAPGMGF